MHLHIGAISNALASCYPVSHCLGREATEHCKTRFNLPIMISVIVCNLVKVLCMDAIVWKVDPYPLVILSDAIASILDNLGTYFVMVYCPFLIAR